MSYPPRGRPGTHWSAKADGSGYVLCTCWLGADHREDHHQLKPTAITADTAVTLDALVVIARQVVLLYRAADDDAAARERLDDAVTLMATTLKELER